MRFCLNRRLLQFRLRTLMLFMLVCSLLLAWSGTCLRAYWFERRVISAIEDIEDPLEIFL